jgi:membrane-associated protease RseP (regulator of RpoE activity)
MGLGRSTYHVRGRAVEVGWSAAALYVLGIVALARWSPAGLAVLVGLTVLVLVHESGHLVAARRCGIAASEYFAGFGPVVLAWRTTDGLRVGLKAIPAGGYVKVVGMSSREAVPPDEEATTYRAASRLRRLAVVSAGPLVNVAFGFLLLFGAATLGERQGPADAVADAWDRSVLVTTATFEGLGALMGDLDGYATAVADPDAADEAPTRFLSPIGVAQLSTEVAADGPLPWIRLMGIASIGLGVMNALPLPPLDGGHAAVVGAESVIARIRRRPSLRLDTSNRVVAAVTAVTFALVLVLGASAIVFDLASPVRL